MMTLNDPNHPKLYTSEFWRLYEDCGRKELENERISYYNDNICFDCDVACCYDIYTYSFIIDYNSNRLVTSRALSLDIKFSNENENVKT